MKTLALKTKTVIFFILLLNTLLIANSTKIEKELISALRGGVETTKNFLKKVPTYHLYEDEKTILHYAVELKKYDVVEFLIHQEIDLSRRGGLYYQTALQDAIFYQNFNIANLLINSGTELNIKNIDGDTALHLAARNGYFDMVRILLNNGASKNIYNNNHQTPYDLVPKFTMQNNKAIKVLLKPNKNIRIQETSKRKSKITTANEINQQQASLILNQMQFKDQVGVSLNDTLDEKSSQLDIINDATIKNSNIGININSH